MTLAGEHLYQATDDLLAGGVTLILFSGAEGIMAEIVGPEGHEDAVEPMPEALATAWYRCAPHGTPAVLDDEELWQESWGTLQR